ncbi:MAG: phosphocholine cytidylyltransferase family protein [Pseudomonadota bacterium]
MTNAIILSAGQGRRLSPLTDARPKCLVVVGGRTILEWQLHALAAAGVRAATVVTGFGAAAVEAALRTFAVDIRVETLFNPFFSVSDNTGSCWLARDLATEDSLLLNGDTLFDADVPRRLLREAGEGVSVTVDVKDRYDADDMKVRFSGDRLSAIGKRLTGPVDGESIGMLRFRGAGGARFRAALAEALADPARLSTWYLSIIDDMARTENGVGVVRLRGERWCEVDFPADIPVAEATVAGFGPARAADAARRARA